MEFAVHTVLLLTILHTTTRAQNLDPIQMAPNLPNSYESYYGSENEVISDNDKLQNDSQPPYTSGPVFSPDIQGIMSFRLCNFKDFLALNIHTRRIS